MFAKYATKIKQKSLAEVEIQIEKIDSELKKEKDKSEPDEQKTIRLQDALDKYQQAQTQLQNANLERIVKKLESHESQIKEGLRELEEVSRDINKAVDFLAVVKRGLNAVSNIIGLLL